MASDSKTQTHLSNLQSQLQEKTWLEEGAKRAIERTGGEDYLGYSALCQFIRVLVVRLFAGHTDNYMHQLFCFGQIYLKMDFWK